MQKYSQRQNLVFSSCYILKSKRQQVKLILIMFYLTQYIKNIIISTNLKNIKRHFTFLFFFVLPLKFGLPMFQVFSSHMRQVAITSLEHRLWEREFYMSLNKYQENSEGKQMFIKWYNVLIMIFEIQKYIPMKPHHRPSDTINSTCSRL